MSAVLVVVDGSAAGDRALAWALDIASARGVLLQIVRPYRGAADSAECHAARGEMDRLVSWLRAEGMIVGAALRAGGTVDAVLAEAAACGAGLIVMPAGGDAAAEVPRRASVPVLVVPGRAVPTMEDARGLAPT